MATKKKDTNEEKPEEEDEGKQVEEEEEDEGKQVEEEEEDEGKQVEEEEEDEGKQVEEEEEDEEEDESLPFARARVVRAMRQHLDSDKMIKAEVKKAMNLFLGEIVADVSKRMNKYPYAMMDYRIFEEAIEPYKTMGKVREEKKRIVAHLDAIKLDCDKLIRDVDETFKE
jgi:hypothetical protein